MRKFTLLILLVLGSLPGFSQDFTGQWKGQFIDNSTTFMGWGGDRCDYVLELDCKGDIVTGYSYTYFNEAGKRYYTICKLKGKINRSTQTVEVTETERTKTNVPNNIRNCFQIHRLNYSKQGDDQTLEGSWVPAPKQEGDCGYGTTVLTRRVMKRSAPLFNKSTARTEKSVPKTNNKLNEVFKDRNKVTPPVVKAAPHPKNIVTPPANPVEQETVKRQQIPVEKSEPSRKIEPDLSFEKRNNNLIKTIEISSETFRVDLYDNGEIDGDTISLIFNGKLILAQKRLSSKPISLTLNVDGSRDVNELIMYAENLGEIPPNTALMVVTDGTQRHEVRIASDLKKSGSIRFVHSAKTSQ